MLPEITAVITTHVRPAAVCEALASVQAESHKDVEVVVVDDGGAFVAPSDAEVPVRVINGSNLGVARARNAGLAAARGEFVIYLDDDDVALPNRISSLLSAAKRQRASLCFGMTRRVDSGTGASLQDVPTHGASAAGAVGFCDLLTCAPHVNAVLVRTDALRAVGGFDERADYFDDWSAWLRIADCNTIMWRIPDTVAEWRIHPHGLSGKVLHLGVMKRRVLSLFDHLRVCLSSRNRPAIARAQEVVSSTEIVTYDDYARVMAEARERLHAAGRCFGGRSH